MGLAAPAPLGCGRAHPRSRRAGEDGLLFLALNPNGKAYAVASGVELFLEKKALGAEMVAARAHQLAGGTVRVIGWPNAHTYEFAHALASDRSLPVETVTTYP